MPAHAIAFEFIVHYFRVYALKRFGEVNKKSPSYVLLLLVI